VTIRVALLGGDELVRRGLEGMLATLGDFEIGSLKAREQQPIDVALVETCGLAPDDSTLTRALADPFIRRVAVYTWNHHPGLAHDVLRRGVAGYLGKSLTAAELGRALRSVHAGEQVVAPAHLARPGQPLASAAELDRLTTRERETLALIATGMSNAEIARDMGISPNSVKSYIRSAYRKTGVRSRSQAVLWAVSHGLSAEAAERA
jgi:DNA-binding NarL/FixJ family response regulator